MVFLLSLEAFVFRFSQVGHCGGWEGMRNKGQLYISYSGNGIHGTSIPHYTLCGNNAETWARLFKASLA